jgi:murein biosynthesis integral membrane protein MurJ
MLSPATAISVLVFASLVLGLMRDLMVAYFFGADWHADLYFLALIIPLFFENSLAASLRDTLVPTFIRKREEGTAAYHDMVARIGGGLALVSVVLVLAFAVTSGFWLKVLGGARIGDHGSHVMAAFSIGIAMIPVVLWSYFLTSICHSENWFVLPAWRGVVFNLGAILALTFLWRSTEGLLAGMLVGQLLHALVVQRQLRFVQLRMPMLTARPGPDIAELLPQFLTLLAVALLLQLGISAERLIASWTGAGGLSRLSYAFRIVTVPLVIFGFAVVGIAYARFSRAVAVNDRPALALAMRDTTRICVYLLLPAAVAMFVFSGELLALLLQRGAFTESDVLHTAQVMEAYAVGLPAMGLSLVLGRLHVAERLFRRLLLSTLLAVALMCAAYFAVYSAWSIEGLAIVTSAGAALQCVLLWITLPRDLRGILSRRDLLALVASFLLLVLLVPLCAGHGVPGILAGGVLSLTLPAVVLLLLMRREMLSTLARALGRQS